MGLYDMPPKTPDELAVREFIRNQRDYVERKIEQTFRKEGNATRRISVRCFNVLPAILEARDEEQLIVQAIQAIAVECLQQHPKFRLHRVRMTKLFADESERIVADVEIHVRPRLFGRS